MWTEITEYREKINLSTPQTETDSFANSVDPDETAQTDPSHLDLHYLPGWS